jgi:hypothetical protein
MIQYLIHTFSLALCRFLPLTLLLSCALVSQVYAQSSLINVGLGPSLVPDRPGYADSTASVDPGHWHLELGGSLVPDQDATMTGLVRYGLAYGWELRLMSPTLTHVYPYEGADGVEITPDMAVGGTQFGAKWAKRWARLEWSVVSMVGLPLAGVEKAFTPDALFSLGTQISHSLNRRLAAGLALKYGLHDGFIYGQEVAYGEELTHLFGMVGALTWSEVGYSLFTQAGAELFGEVITPLIGGGTTIRLTRGSQIDLSLDAPLTSEGVTARYMAGLTLSW